MPVVTIIPLRKPIIRNQEVLDAVAHIPRKHLGHAYYQSRLGPEPSVSAHLSQCNPAKRRGFASTPLPLPRFEGKENCTFTVKVPRIYLTHTSREEITARKGLWGTDIYTDDSDIIAACIHQGWFKGAWPADVDESLLGLTLDNDGAVHSDPSLQDVWLQPPSGGPADVPKDRDLHVTIVILPLLRKYGSLTRFGIKSREWGGKYDGSQSKHDGLSFMIEEIQWVDGVDGQEGRSKSERKEIVKAQLRDAELDAAEVLSGLVPYNNVKGNEESMDWGILEGPEGEITALRTGNWWRMDNARNESYERGGKGPETDIASIGIGRWSRRNDARKERAKENAPEPEGDAMEGVIDSTAPAAVVDPETMPPSSTEQASAPEAKEGDVAVENDQDRRISRVTELMIANANFVDSIPTPSPAPGSVVEAASAQTSIFGPGKEVTTPVEEPGIVSIFGPRRVASPIKPANPAPVGDSNKDFTPLAAKMQETEDTSALEKKSPPMSREEEQQFLKAEVARLEAETKNQII